MFEDSSKGMPDWPMPKLPYKLLFGVVALIVVAILFFSMIGINDAGNRTVIQYPKGTIKIKFDPGWYVTYFGSETVYRDVITFDFDKELNEEEVTINQQGVAVRYQDGGMGTIFGKARFNLPNDEPTMMKLHKEFRSNRGVAHKLLKSNAEESMNLTAGLMSSEESYAEKRSQFTDWAKQQVEHGKFKTRLRYVSKLDEVTGKQISKKVPEIVYGDDGLPVQLSSDLKRYGITVTGFQITDWDFEKKTLNQIAAKREATMAIITAKAEAERAKQEAITAEEKGKANVMKAKYEKEQEKIKAVVDAEKAKEVAVIAAMQKVDVASQNKLEAEQKKLAAVEYKQEQILIGEGDGERKRLVMLADGALAQKLKTYENVMANAFSAVAKQKWVPEVMMTGSGGTTNGSPANDLIEMFKVNVAKDLALDMTMKGTKAPVKVAKKRK